MEPVQLEKWRSIVLPRLEALKVHARQTRQYMEMNNLDELRDDDS